jgi:hypothetical protein
MAIKTTWTEVNQIIKEEFQRVMEKKKLQNRIQQINEELAHMEEEDASLVGEEEKIEEVEAGSLEKLNSETGLEPNVKYAAKFDHKGSHLMEDELEDELEVELGDLEDEEGSLADEFAELGAAIEAKIMAALGKAEMIGNTENEEEENEEEDFEEVEVEMEDEKEEGEEENKEEEEEEEEEEDTMDEYSHMAEKESINESVSKKDKRYLNVLSEGLDARKKNALESEIERMRRLARLGNND